MSENSSLLQSQAAASQSGSLAESGQFVVAPIVPAENIVAPSSEVASENTISNLANTDHLPVALTTEDPILLTNLVGTIRGLIFSTFGSDITGDEMTRKYNIMRTLRKDASQMSKRIIDPLAQGTSFDDSPAKPSDTIH